MKRLNDSLAAPVDSDSAVALANAREKQGAVPRVDQALGDPDLAPEGWVSRIGPQGQRYWHHRALGPAPWETDQEARELDKEVAFARPGPTGRPPGSGCGYYPGSSVVSGPGSFTDQPASYSGLWEADGRRGGQLPPTSPLQDRAGDLPLAPARPPKTWSGPASGGALGGQSQSALAAMSRDVPFPSPDQAPEDWISVQRPDGRTFWHNRALGPAPWAEQKSSAPPPAPGAFGGRPEVPVATGHKASWHSAQPPPPPPMPMRAG